MLMKDQTLTDVLIDGKTYTIAGFESDEYMQKVAGYINRKVAELKKNEDYRHLDLDLRNTLLAINITDDYFKEIAHAEDIKSDRELKDKLVLDLKHEIISREEQLTEKEKEISDLNKKLINAEKRIVELETTLRQKK